MRTLVFLVFLATAFHFKLHAQSKIEKVENFKSQFVKERNVEIWLPAEYFSNPKQKFPVLYMHDGQNVFNTETAPFSKAWDIDNMAEQLVKENKIAPCIIVASWHTGNTRYMEYFPEKASNYLTEAQKTKIKDLALQMKVSPEWLGDKYLKFMTSELKPYIDKTYRTLPDAKNTSVCGSSMGGLISIYALCEYPNVFGQAACVSPHWPVLFDNSDMGPSDAIRAYLKDHLPSPKNHRIYFDYGTKTLDQYYEVHQKMVDEIMRVKGYTEGKNWVTQKFEGEEHSERSWIKRMDVILLFLYKK